MADDNLDPKGTRIEYSICGCEWKPVEIPTLMHTGDKYFQDWTVPADLPAEVLIRITARDLAGNVTTVQSPGKVLVDLVAPEGKITDLHGDAAEPELGPMPRMVQESPTIQLPALMLLRSVAPVILNQPSLPGLSLGLDVQGFGPDRGPNAVVAWQNWLRRIANSTSCSNPIPRYTHLSADLLSRSQRRSWTRCPSS
jgi:hypothetical protein